MADIKTTLRELSVATTIGLFIKNGTANISELLNPEGFIYKTKKILQNNIDEKILDFISLHNGFDDDLIKIVQNGYTLGEHIFKNKYFKFNYSDEILWLGGNTQKETPEDIVVGNYKFSLKEDSYILENMGLYKLLNCLTGSSHKKGVHFFKRYSPDEYSTWFTTTWKLLLNYLEKNKIWSFRNGESEIQLLPEGILLKHNKNTVILPADCSLEFYETQTTSKIREKVFSKFIHKELSNDDNYKQAKKICAEVASENLAKELNSNLNYKSGLDRFLRIHEEPYYYAKVNNKICEIYKVPSTNSLGEDIIISSITHSVPYDQANILTTITNKKINTNLTFRNECRFSHGQFNGTPEAKLYYENNSNLTSIYEKL